MKKFTSMLLASLLVFSLGTTAFASGDTGSADTDTNFIANSGETNVSVKAGAVDNLSATVPLNVTLAIKADGSIVAPETTAYKINNTGAVPFHVSAMKVSLMNRYNFSTTPGQDTLDLTLKPGAGAAVTLASGDNTLKKTDWQVLAKTDLGLLFAGSVGTITADTVAAADKVFTVTYTLTAGKAPTTP